MSSPDTACRRSLLVGALGFLLLERAPQHPGLGVLHRWLDTWTAIGHVATGMYRQGFLVSLGQCGEQEWLAVFYTRGGGHSVMSAAGTAKEATPWRAVQRAAWGALMRTPT
jgi:hypothetical protein